MPRKTDPDKTPRLKGSGRVAVICPFCKKPVELMPSGLLALHAVQGRWARSMCRGSGARVHPR